MLLLLLLLPAFAVVAVVAVVASPPSICVGGEYSVDGSTCIPCPSSGYWCAGGSATSAHALSCSGGATTPLSWDSAPSLGTVADCTSNGASECGDGYYGNGGVCTPCGYGYWCQADLLSSPFAHVQCGSRQTTLSSTAASYFDCNVCTPGAFYDAVFGICEACYLGYYWSHNALPRTLGTVPDPRCLPLSLLMHAIPASLSSINPYVLCSLCIYFLVILHQPGWIDAKLPLADHMQRCLVNGRLDYPWLDGNYQ